MASEFTRPWQQQGEPDIELNPILDADSYKYSHPLQDPPQCSSKTYYIEPRVGGEYDFVIPFGFSAVLQKMFSEPLTHEYVAQAGPLIEKHGLPFSWSQFHSIVDHYKGNWPVQIDTIDEGTPVKVGNILVKVKSTDNRFPWVGGFLETALMRVWYPTTVCTKSYRLKQIIKAALEKTSDAPDAELPFKLHDFGCRGVPTRDTAMLGGMAHLVNFMGTDTVPALVGAIKYYGANGPVGFSIPAAEHGTILSWGPKGEYSAFDNMLTQFARDGKIVAVVSDTYDLWNAIDVLWGERLKDKIIRSGAMVVIRPDSGIPEDVVLECLNRLGAKFGYTMNKKGYKVLNHVRVIQGDGITEQSLPVIIDRFVNASWSASNVAFGMGGGLLQQVNRDTARFAMKVCEVTVNNMTYGVRKCPIDAPWKASKAGDLDLVLRDNKFATIDRRDPSTYMGPDGERASSHSELTTRYFNGWRNMYLPSFNDIRQRTAQPIR